MRQVATFLGGEGDAWFKRNLEAPLNPIVVNTLTSIDSKPKLIVEVGCGYGRYLNEMQKKYDCRCIGYDPSSSAIHHGKNSYPKLELHVGASESFWGLKIDIIVFGFCLYLVDRNDLFRIVGLADQCLNDGGHIVIHDFDVLHPEVIPYHHKAGVFSYKMDYPGLWLANPAYSLVSARATEKGSAITVIKKGSWNESSPAISIS